VVQTWGEMIETYLSTRQTLKGVVLLMDIRRTPGQDEMDLISWFQHYAIPTCYVLTKADKFSNQKRKVHHEKCGETLGIPPSELICFSAKTRLGRERLLDQITPWISE
jgi:GTP-binding protein